MVQTPTALCLLMAVFLSSLTSILAFSIVAACTQGKAISMSFVDQTESQVLDSDSLSASLVLGDNDERTQRSDSPRPRIPPIVYTIAGSDSGGGAGIQADLQAIHAMGGHGCSAITCLTAQNSVGVTAVHAPPASFLLEQLNALRSDLRPLAIKIGMLGTKELARTVGSFLRQLKEGGEVDDNTQHSPRRKIWVVLDPVMISTSGSRLLESDAEQAMVEEVFPYADILTPNKYEAEALLGRKLHCAQDVEQGARDLLMKGVKAVLIKGGHTDNDGGYADDYFLSAGRSLEDIDEDTLPRLCDEERGVWLRSRRYNTKHTHGTGCTLSSSIATALALGELARRQPETVEVMGEDTGNAPLCVGGGAIRAIGSVDACCLGKAYVTAGISQGVGLGQGPGPVAQTLFPSSSEHFPRIADADVSDKSEAPSFRQIRASSNGAGDQGAAEDVMGRILPIVDSVDWVQHLCAIEGIQDIQLRIKNEKDVQKIKQIVESCNSACRSANVRLWVNDHWKAAVEAGCYGVHVGQEDLLACIQEGGLEILRSRNMALGVSTHSFGELSAALGVNPSYISLGPVFGTTSKQVAFSAQGLSMVSRWRKLIPSTIPLVTIGGIGNASIAGCVRRAGADCVAVIGAVTKEKETAADVVAALNVAMRH